MTLKEAIKVIKTINRKVIHVVLCENDTPLKKVLIEDVDSLPEIIEDIDLNAQFQIKIYTANGSTTSGTINSRLFKTLEVENIMTMSNLNGISQTQAITHQPVGIDAMSQVLQFQLSSVTKERDKFETQNERLLSENQKLREDNFELQKDLKFKDKEFEIERRTAESEASKGLGGFIEKIERSDKLMGLIEVLATTAITKAMPQGESHVSEPDLFEEPSYHAQAAKRFNQLTANLDQPTLSNLLMMVSAYSQDTNALNQMVENIKQHQHKIANS